MSWPGAELNVQWHVLDRCMCCVQTQMIKGFERVQQQLSNAAAGGATAQTCFATFQQHAESHGWLPVEAPVA